NYEDITQEGIRINKTWNYKEIGSSSGYQSTKNSSSMRTVVIDDTLRDLLNKYWEFKLKHDLNDKDTPFLLENGKHPLNSTVNDKLRKIEKDLELPDISFHKLRHTYVSVLID